MSKYLLKVTGSNEIINIVEWDGEDSLVAPFGYVLEPFVDENTDFINYYESVDLDNIPVISGNLFGQFTGELTGSITLNGKTIDELIHQTKYGEVTLISGSNVPNLNLFNEVILSENNIILPQSSIFNDDKDYVFAVNYESILNKIVDENIQNYVISFKQKQDPTIKLEYLVHQTELSASGDLIYYNISASLFSDISLDEHQSSLTNWYVDFDLGESPKVGTFYGDFNGTIDGKKVEDILDSQGINATKYPILKYENASNINSTSLIVPNYLDTDEAPKRNYFRFDKERGNAFWNDPLLTQNQVEEVTLSLDSLDIDSQNILRNLVYDMLLGNWSGSSLTLRSIDYPNTYKTFRIFSAVAYQKQFINNQTPRYYELLMGDNWRIIDTSMMLDPDFRFKNEHQYSLPNDGRISYVKLFVQEVESGMDEFRFPQHDDAFSIFITKDKVKRKEVFEFTSTTTPWQVPSWADKLTIYSIGAGGGGGAGADAWYHAFSLQGGFKYDESTMDLNTADIGFEFATGGGGGAGGNVAISEFLIDKVGTNIDATNIGKKYLPINSNLNIYVGSGGRGGQKLNCNDPNHFQIIPAKNIVKNHYLKWIEALLGSELYKLSGSSNWILRSFWDMQSFSNTNWRLQAGISSAMGKPGGSSLIVLDKNSNNINNLDIELIKATGGLGGMHGVAIQTYYGVYHYLCGSLSHDMDQPNALGGGSYLNDSFSNKELRAGGHGGYGVSMPTYKPNFSRLKTWKDGGKEYNEFVRPLPSIKTDKFRIHLAPNIPWGDNSDKPNLKTPIGYNYILKQGETFEVDGWKCYENGSNEQPTKVAPLGGNGGLGANFTYTLDPLSEYILYLPNNFVRVDFETTYWERSNGFPKLNVPDNWFRVLSDKIANSISWDDSTDRPKLIGDNTLIPITDVTAVNGNGSVKRYSFTLKEEGAMGGIKGYDTISRGLMSTTLDKNPENGLHYGQGGGGGRAGYRGWTWRNDPLAYGKSDYGGNGADGIVIIIAEEL